MSNLVLVFDLILGGMDKKKSVCIYLEETDIDFFITFDLRVRCLILRVSTS